MTDNTELKRLAKAAPSGPWIAENDSLYFKDDGYTRHMLDADAGHDVEDEAYYAALKFIAAANPAAVLGLIAENEALKGPHDWLAEDLIKELVDNAQAIQENADDGEEDPFVIVLLASASRIRRQEANIDKLRAENEQLAKTADCWDRLNIQNKALSDSFRAERDQLKAENERLAAACERAEQIIIVECKAASLAKVRANLLEADRDQLRAEIAGLKTGYEAYERVNAELKAECARSTEREILQLAEIEVLRKDAERYRMVRGIASISASRRHLVVKRRPVNGFSSSTARDFDASIDAAMGKGEQS